MFHRHNVYYYFCDTEEYNYKIIFKVAKQFYFVDPEIRNS